MELLKKGIALCLLVAMVLTMAPQSVNACTREVPCPGTGIVTTHTNVSTVDAGNHQIGEPSGTVINCHITVIYGEHRINCAGCGAFMGYENRTCSMIHSSSKYCTNRYNLCK